VSLIRERPYEPLGTVTTDADGNFGFTNLQQGQYLLRARRDGHIQADYGESAVSGLGQRVVIQSGQNRNDIVVLMGEGGIVAGVVLDEEKEPAGNITVSLLQQRYEDGRRVFAPVSSTKTDDRGQFRLFGLMPGRYIITTVPTPRFELRGSSVLFMDRPGSPIDRMTPIGRALAEGLLSPEELQGIPSPLYYPNTTDPFQAAPIDVDYGSTASLVLSVMTAPAFRIRGRVVNTAGEAVRPSSLSLSSRELSPRSQQPRNAIIQQDGTFEFLGVPPGNYDLVGFVSGQSPPSSPGQPSSRMNPPPPPPPPLPPTLDPNRLIGHATIGVSNKDIDNVIVVMNRFTLPGLLRTRDATNPPPGLRVAFRSVPPLLLQPFAAIVNDDGMFTAGPFGEGEYQIFLTGLPPQWYVAAARLGAVDVLNSGFHIDRVPRGNLEVVLAQTSSTLESVVIDEKGMTVPGVFVVAVPDVPRRQRVDLYRSGWTDAQGRLLLEAVAPGQYRVFAWREVENDAWLNGEFIAGLENYGTLVRVRENEAQRLEVRLIAPQP
jgi:hypothetical protein